MTPRKLSDSDRQEIIRLYRLPEESTSTLAAHYGVSNTTISRILKSSLPEAEYEALIQQKKALRFANSTEESEPSLDAEETEAAPEERAAPIEVAVKSRPEPPILANRRQRRRVSVEQDSELESNPEDLPPATLPDLPDFQRTANITPEVMEALNPTSLSTASFNEIREDLLPDYSVELEAEEEEEDLDDDDLDDDDLDDDDLDDDDLDDGDLTDDGLVDLPSIHLQSQTTIQVLPLSEATIPRTVYLVVDRAAELITRPLKDFGDLGQIPEAEIQERTLPVFDNHRVARRFSKKTQRIVKIPDSSMFQKVSTYLQAKGITRLLIDGQVYSL